MSELQLLKQEKSEILEDIERLELKHEHFDIAFCRNFDKWSIGDRQRHQLLVSRWKSLREQVYLAEREVIGYEK